MVSRQTANTKSAAAAVAANVVTPRNRLGIQIHAATKCHEPINNGVGCAVLNAHLALREAPSVVGGNKRPAVPRARRYPDGTRSARSSCDNPRTRCNGVSCAAEDPTIVGLARHLSQDPARRGLCARGSP